jgi:hypothetical protein
MNFSIFSNLKKLKMKTRIRISTSLVLIIFLLSSLTTAFSAQIPPKGDSDVQYIAVHFGHLDHASVMDQSAFPEFQFYSATGSAYSYSEKQKLMGNPENLVGYYGEGPEKMGFCANYTTKKYFTAPYMDGVIYVIDQNGIISYQSPSDQFNEENYPDIYSDVFSTIKSKVKKLKKGKTTKALAKNKCNYLKKSPVGELESKRRSKIDKKGKGLVGWAVPEISIVDDNGNKTKLGDITKDKISIVVFYTLNGVDRKKGDAKGNITDEWIGQKLISDTEYANKLENKVMDGDYKNKADAKKTFAKTMFKAAVVGTAIGNLFNSKEDISDDQKVEAYKECVQRIEMVQYISKEIK